MTAATPLGLVDDELVACVSCGLCLPHCPTYRVTGLEIASPRGRIAAMRAVEAGAIAVDDPAFERAMEECIQCRGCEAACPSSVPFGRLMEDTRTAMEAAGARCARSRLQQIAEWFGLRVVLPRHRLLLALSWVLAVAQRLWLVPRRLGIPKVSMRSLARPLVAGASRRSDAWLFTGCVMDAWMRETHRSALRVMQAAGAAVALPGAGADCCGALHVHAGRRADARRLARRVVASMPGDAPVVVDSAGCGAAMRDYGHLLDTDDARRFSERVIDFSTWVARHPPRGVEPTGRVVVVQDPCHLRHVQRAHQSVRTALARAYELRETDDEGLCCGAGGAYAVLQPDFAQRIRGRKVAAIARAARGAPVVVASANPGCTMHLRAAGLDVRHPADLLADTLRASGEGRGDV